MSCKNTPAQYGSMMRFLHWAIFVLFLIQILMGFFLDDFPEAYKMNIYTFHNSVGLLVLALMLVWVFWRLINVKPVWPVNMALWERVSAHIMHTLLYLGMILIPLSGWALTTAAQHPPVFFWLFPLPMPGIMPSDAVKHLASSAHTVLAWVLISLVALHILAALKHHFINKDFILKRMRPGGMDE
jgi:cytochrome b561